MLEEPETVAFSAYQAPAASHPDADLLATVLTVPDSPAPDSSGVGLLDEALLDVGAFDGGTTASDDEPATLPGVGAAAPPSPPPTFATETMAELYLRQGLVAEAIGVYEALLQQRPGDAALRAKVVRFQTANGLSPVPELTDRLELKELPDEDRGRYNTLAGMIMLLLGRLPRTADAVEWDGWRFEVVDLDGKRVDKVLVSRGPAAHAAVVSPTPTETAIK